MTDWLATAGRDELVARLLEVEDRLTHAAARAAGREIDWRKVKREVLTPKQVRELCAGHGLRGRQSTKPIQPATLRDWRANREFPTPVLTVNGSGGELELWARADVRAWLAERS